MPFIAQREIALVRDSLENIWDAKRRLAARVAAIVVAVTTVMSVTTTVKAVPDTPPKRAKPPQWTQDVTDTFFEDARKHLVGERPSAKSGSAGYASPANAPLSTEPGVELAWSKLIDGETLATEVKRVAAGLREPLQNQSKFKSGGSRQCQADFGWLAVVFAIIAEYDGDVRWQEDAPALRASLARAGRNCKAATDLAFAEATDQKMELDDLIRGSSVGDRKRVGLTNWSSLSDRSLLMQRMDRGFQEGIAAKLSNQAALQKFVGELRHEAEILAVLAEVIVREDYEYWDDETFNEHARELKQAAVELRQAVDAGSYEAARTAAGRAGQACSACHEGYRG